MVEAGAKEVSEEQIVKGIEFAQKESKAVLKLIEDLAEAVGVKRDTYKEEKPSAELESQVKKLVGDKMAGVVDSLVHVENGRSNELQDLIDAVTDNVTEADAKWVPEIVDHLKKAFIREQILKKGKRPDGRKLTEIRELSAQVGYLPRVHGSRTFQTRPNTCSFCCHTWSRKDGPATRVRRRRSRKTLYASVQHGAFCQLAKQAIWKPGQTRNWSRSLAERALMPVIPSPEEFPYAIRVVSEVMSSNGSTSMASVCGSTLSLMDAGVPIKSPVAGIAMGLIFGEKGDLRFLATLWELKILMATWTLKLQEPKKALQRFNLMLKLSV